GALARCEDDDCGRARHTHGLSPLGIAADTGRNASRASIQDIHTVIRPTRSKLTAHVPDPIQASPARRPWRAPEHAEAPSAVSVERDARAWIRTAVSPAGKEPATAERGPLEASRKNPYGTFTRGARFRTGA